MHTIGIGLIGCGGRQRGVTRRLAEHRNGHENGVRAAFHTNCMAGITERRMYLLGTEGPLRADVLSGVIEFKRSGILAESRFIRRNLCVSDGFARP